MKIVRDTNIVVSGLLQSKGNSAQVLTLALAARGSGMPWVLARQDALANQKNLSEQTTAKQQTQRYAQNQNRPRNRKP